jgi:hypothetical protein
VLPRDRLVGVDVRAFLHLGLGQRGVDAPAVPVDVAQRPRRDEDFPAAQPAARVDYQVPDREARVVEIECLDLSDVTISRADRKPPLDLSCS